ncbi:hypothetical protein D3C87_1901760 [compost metagenome]
MTVTGRAVSIKVTCFRFPAVIYIFIGKMRKNIIDLVVLNQIVQHDVPMLF